MKTIVFATVYAALRTGHALEQIVIFIAEECNSASGTDCMRVAESRSLFVFG
ncbi:MAG: hypothetical protein ACOVMP_06420 [Chthoniobacterales bacterium]